MKKIIAFLYFIFFIQSINAQDSICFYKTNHELSYYKDISTNAKYSLYIIQLSKEDTIIKKCNYDTIRFYNVDREKDTFLLCVKKNNKLYYNSTTSGFFHSIYNSNNKYMKIGYQLFKKKDAYFLSLYGGYVSSGVFLFRFKNSDKDTLINKLILTI